MKRNSFLGIGWPVFACFSRLQSIRYNDPELTPANWCEVQPCIRVKIRSRDIILTQPSSSLLVYLLGFLTIGAGVMFLLIEDNEHSRVWWGISLLLWGIGALLAGTSYQAFGYEIKCAGRQSCSWTSWWEVIYLMLQQLSMDAMLVAVACSCTAGPFRTALFVCALVIAAVYVISTFIGAIVPIKALITFRCMVWVSTPILIVFLVLNSYRYYLFRDPMDLALLGTWVLLVLTGAAYWSYANLNITEKLWAKGKGIWFSENDVLHVCLIFWVIYIATVVAGTIKDYSVPAL